MAPEIWRGRIAAFLTAIWTIRGDTECHRGQPESQPPIWMETFRGERRYIGYTHFFVASMLLCIDRTAARHAPQGSKWVVAVTRERPRRCRSVSGIVPGCLLLLNSAGAFAARGPVLKDDQRLGNVGGVIWRRNGAFTGLFCLNTRGNCVPDACRT
jgi:hypothetical protein